MSYQIAKSRPVGRELRRVATRQLAGARKALTRKTRNVAFVVHDARRRVKKTRAVLRLARRGLGRKHFLRENRLLRDAGRGIRAARDAVALIEVLDVVSHDCYESRPPAILRILRRLLVREAGLRGREIEAEGILERTQCQLRGELKRVKDWNLKDFGEHNAHRALHRARKAFREASATAAAAPTDENLHEWRKRARYLWNESLLLRNRCPKLCTDIETIEALASILGEDRDLALLARAITSHKDRLGFAAQRRTVLALLASRRKSLQAAAFTLTPI